MLIEGLTAERKWRRLELGCSSGEYSSKEGMFCLPLFGRVVQRRDIVGQPGSVALGMRSLLLYQENVINAGFNAIGSNI